jgi:Fic family protein
MLNQTKIEKIQALKLAYEQLRGKHNELLKMIAESELPEMVYNSNAIENSSLTLKETEKILLAQALMREISLRETYEATNLARVIKYLWLNCYTKCCLAALTMTTPDASVGRVNMCV